MELKRAVSKVTKFCQKKQGNLGKMVRLVPGDPAALWAYDGRAGCLCYLDPGLELPECLVDAAWLTGAVRGSKDKIEVWLAGPREVVFSVGGVELKGEAHAVAGYPEVPDLPKLQAFDGFQVVPQVAGFAADFDPYAVVKIGPKTVEATDTAVAVRADLDGLPEGLVPAQVFKSWPAGKVKVGRSGEWAFYQVGEEVRAAYWQVLEYPDMARAMPQEANEPWTTVDRLALLTALEHAVVAADHGAVMLGWDERGGKVDALGDNGSVVSSFNFLVWETCLGNGGQGVLVSGKPLVKALKGMWSARVLLRLANGALRVESGPFTVCVWPMRPAGG